MEPAAQSAWERIQCVEGDLTRAQVDVVVNAANETLRGGGGVDGALHRAAGPELLEACIRLHPGGCPTGEVRVTPGFRLPARWVIHTVGPVWHGGGHGEAELLAACHERALAAAERLGARTVAFPAISCGVYGYPWGLAAETALRALHLGLVACPGIEEVRVVLFHKDLLECFRTAHTRLCSARI